MPRDIISRVLRKLPEEAGKREEEGGGASLTNSSLPWPPAADIGCGSFQIVTGPPKEEEEADFIPRLLRKLPEEADKRERGGGASLTNFSPPLPPAADIGCGSGDPKEKEDVLIDKEEEEEDEEEESASEEEDIRRDDSPPMPKEYWIRYFQQVEESEGFDVDDFPGRTEDNLLGPLNMSPYDDDLSIEIGRHAINRYNTRKKGAPIEFVRVVNIITKYDGWMPQYVTLEGKDTGDDNKIKTYQALVLIAPDLGGHVLKMFRLKPSAETPTSEEKKHPLGECCGECLRANVVQDDEAGPEHETPLPPAKKPRVENDEEQPQEHLQPQSSANSSPSKDDCNDDYDSDDLDPMSYEEIFMRNFEISLEAPVNGFASVDEEEEFFMKYLGNHAERKSPHGPKYTLEDVERYYEQLEDSRGFDVDYFPDMENLSFITPVRDEEVVNNRFTEHAKLAIEFHNKEEGGQLQLRKIIKVNCLNIQCCPHAYITFEAIDAADGVHDEPKTYQARILTIPGRIKVEEVRLKP